MESLQTKSQEVDALMDPSRFIYVHHFLTEFQHKFEDTYASRMEELKVIRATLEVLQENKDPGKELNDEVIPPFPKSAIRILRRLQDALGITGDEMKYRLKRTIEILDGPCDSDVLVKKVMSNYVQTEPLKEFEAASNVCRCSR